MEKGLYTWEPPAAHWWSQGGGAKSPEQLGRMTAAERRGDVFKTLQGLGKRGTVGEVGGKRDLEDAAWAAMERESATTTVPQRDEEMPGADEVASLAPSRGDEVSQKLAAYAKRKKKEQGDDPLWWRHVTVEYKFPIRCDNLE